MKVLTTVTLLAVGIAVSAQARADDGLRLPGLRSFGIAPAPSKLVDDQPRAAAEAEPVENKPLEKVLEAIGRRLPGRALGAQMVEWQGREAYAIRWIGEDGKVHDITADAVSGDIVEER